MSIFLDSDLNIMILNYLICCDKHFNIFLNCNKSIKNNFLNNPLYYKLESMKNFNLFLHYKSNMYYYKNKFYHLKNSLANAMNQNIYLFGDENSTDSDSEDNFETESDGELELHVLH